MSRKIEIHVLDSELDCIYFRDGFLTIREATDWVKSCGYDQSWWDRLAENQTFAPQVYQIQIVVDGVEHSNWWPAFKERRPS